MRKLLIGITGISFMIWVGSVAAANLVIEGNGSGSQNGINLQQNNQTNVQQSNQMNVSNDVNASANTGGNSVSGGNGGSVTTGNASVNVTIDNNLNHNWSDVGCCGAPPAGGPTPKPGTTPTPVPSGSPTPTPKSGDGDGGKSDGGGGGGGSSGGGGGVGGGQVLGLSATSGEFAWPNLFYLGSGVCLLAARKFLHAAA